MIHVSHHEYEVTIPTQLFFWFFIEKKNKKGKKVLCYEIHSQLEFKYGYWYM